MEIWRDIPGYEGLYQVSNLGRIKSLYDGGHKTHRELIRKPDIRKDGYLQVKLCKNNVAKTYLIHRLVATAFIPNPHNKPYLDHINTIIDDNRVENLRWVTQKENMNNPKTKKNCKENSAKVNLGRTLSDETKRKISEARKGKYCGKNHPCYGKPRSKESKEKQREKMKGRYDGKNNPFYGRHHTDETKKKISESKKKDN